MPRRETSTAVAIVVACVMLFSVTPYSVLADSEQGSRASGSAEIEPQAESQDPSSPGSEWISSEALPEQSMIEGWTYDELHMVGKVPWYDQDGPTCGQYSVTNVLNWYGVHVTPRQVMDYVGDGETYVKQLEGTLHAFLGEGAWHDRGGFSDKFDAAGFVAGLLSKQIPVIAQIRPPGSDASYANHFVTILGYDSTGWFIHDTAGWWKSQWDVHVTFNDFDGYWNNWYWDSDSSIFPGERGWVAANRYWGDGFHPYAKVSVPGGVPNVYDNCEDLGTPYAVEVALENLGEEGGIGASLWARVVGAKIVSYSLGDWDSSRTRYLSGELGNDLPATYIEFYSDNKIPTNKLGDAALKATLYLYPTADSQTTNTGRIFLNGWIGDEEDVWRSSYPDTFVKDDSNRSYDESTHQWGVLMPGIHQLRLLAGLEDVSISYKILDNDLYGPTLNLPTPASDYVSDSGAVRIWAEASDLSGISLVQIRYRFSDSAWSDWLEATGNGGLYSVFIPPEVWQSRAGEVIYWQAYAVDCDNDFPGDSASSTSAEFSAVLPALMLKVVAESPVNIMVTSPCGLSVGYDPVLGPINEIAGATYSGPGTEPQIIVIPSANAGTHRIDAFGTGSGSFTITSEFYAPNGSLVGRLIWTGVAEPGGQYSRSIAFQPDGIVYRSLSVNGTVFLDQYNPGTLGQRDENEGGLGNCRVSFDGWTVLGTWLNRIQYTDNLLNVGLYEFSDLPEGAYLVNITCTAGFYYTTPISRSMTIDEDTVLPGDYEVDFGVLLPGPDPELSFVLNKGWNLWSTPLKVNSLTAKSLLAKIGPNSRAVSMLDEAQGKYVSYATGYPDSYDFAIVPGEGYFVYVSDKTVFRLTGTLEGSQSSLCAGWNLIGYSGIEQRSASELLASVSGAYARALTYLDSASGVYRSYATGYSSAYDFAVTPGRAYFIWVDGPGTLA